MVKFFKKLLGVFLLACFLLNGTLRAAMDGQEGILSSGTSKIMLMKESQIIATPEKNSFTVVDLTADDLYSDVCVYANSGKYYVNAQSSQEENKKYLLKNEGGKYSIGYDVKWKDNYKETFSSLKQLAFLGESKDKRCSGGSNAKLKIVMDMAAFLRAPLGKYIDVLTIIVSPE